MQNLINVVSLIGPTASGKTRLGVDLAKHFNAEIISADSMQIYQGMQIATAKPAKEEMCGVKHHLIDFLPPDCSYSVAMFVDDAAKCISDIHGRGKLPMIVGGTGLYVDSLLNNIKFNDEIRDETRSEELWQIYREKGVDELLGLLGEIDPESKVRLETERNPKRIIRAIEFYNTTGITITEQIKNSMNEQSPYRAIKLGLNFNDREKLYDRINKRVDLMLEQGLLEEAEKVLNSELSFTSVKAIGYKELAPYFNNEKTLEECIENLKRSTRRYAKRQITWFKRDTDIHWLYVDSYSSYEDMFSEAVNIINEGLLYG